MCKLVATCHECVVAIPCKRWGCSWCGQTNALRLAAKVAAAEPTKLITLTINPQLFITPRDAFNATRRKVSDLSKLIRKHHGDFEYLRILEVTKKGWPHYHLVAKCPYVPQSWLSQQWAALTGAKIVDIRKIKKHDNVYHYVMKYLCKQGYIEWTNRRVCWSKSFFPKPDEKEKFRSPYFAKTVIAKHPADVLQSKYFGRTVVREKPHLYVIQDQD